MDRHPAITGNSVKLLVVRHARTLNSPTAAHRCPAAKTHASLIAPLLSTAAPGHPVSDVAAAAVSEAIDRLRDRREVRLAPRPARPGSTVLYDIAGEERARQIAAAPHAAFHGDLDPLARAVPTA